MKAINKLLLAALPLLVLSVSCGRMDDVYQEFISDGPVTYLSKLTGVETFAGENRVKFVIPAQTDPRTKGVMVYWDNRTCSIDVPIDPSVTNEFVVDNVVEGSHIFELLAHDSNGNNSIAISKSVASYGEKFIKSASPSVVVSACRNAAGTTLMQIRHSISSRYQNMELTYTATDGQSKTIEIGRGDATLYIDDMAGDSYSYRSVYLPEDTAFEQIFSPVESRSGISSPQIVVDSAVSLDYYNGSVSEIDCNTTWLTEISIDSEASSWLSAQLNEQTLHIQTLARNIGTSERKGTITITSDQLTETVTVTQKAASPYIGTEYINSEGTAEGVIFWQNPEKPDEFKILSRYCNCMAWSTQKSSTGAKSYTGVTSIDGVDYSNNDLIRNMEDYEDNYYALSWIESLGDGWYMPSLNEMKDEFWPAFNGTAFDYSTKASYSEATDDEKTCRDAFDAVMLGIGGDKVNMASDTGAGSCIMTCTEKDASTQVAFRVGNPVIFFYAKNVAYAYARGVKIVTID